MLLVGRSFVYEFVQIHDIVTSTRHRNGRVVNRMDILESPPVVSVPLYGTGSPTQAYDMLKFEDRTV